MLPKEGDSWVAKYASGSYFREILKNGAYIYWYYRVMLHAINMVIKDGFTYTGTTNMDYRSFNINFEINALIFDDSIIKKINK